MFSSKIRPLTSSLRGHVTQRILSPSISMRYSSCSFSTVKDSVQTLDLFNPTEEHASLRKMIREFAEKEVDPQALEFNRLEKFNVELFRKLGELGLLGITVESEYGGSGMDATAAVIVHGKKFLHAPFL